MCANPGDLDFRFMGALSVSELSARSEPSLLQATGTRNSAERIEPSYATSSGKSHLGTSNARCSTGPVYLADSTVPEGATRERTFVLSGSQTSRERSE